MACCLSWLISLLDVLREWLERLVVSFLCWVGCPPRAKQCLSALLIKFWSLVWIIFVIHQSSVIWSKHLISVAHGTEGLTDASFVLCPVFLKYDHVLPFLYLLGRHRELPGKETR